MTDEIRDFVDALERYVLDALRQSGQPADYNVETLCVVDARNHLFRPAGKRPTDEATDVYALRDLCHVDEDTLDVVPDRTRLAAVARNYFF